MDTKRDTRSLTRLALRAVALAMGVAVIVVNTLGTAQSAGSVMLLGIGLAALALADFL